MTLSTADPAYQQDVPNLDGGEGCSEHIIHGTNIDITPPTVGGAETEGSVSTVSSVDAPGGQSNNDD